MNTLAFKHLCLSALAITICISYHEKSQPPTFAYNAAVCRHHQKRSHAHGGMCVLFYRSWRSIWPSSITLIAFIHRVVPTLQETMTWPGLLGTVRTGSPPSFVWERPNYDVSEWSCACADALLFVSLKRLDGSLRNLVSDPLSRVFYKCQERGTSPVKQVRSPFPHLGNCWRYCIKIWQMIRTQLLCFKKS